MHDAMASRVDDSGGRSDEVQMRRQNFGTPQTFRELFCLQTLNILKLHLHQRATVAWKQQNEREKEGQWRGC